MKPEPDTETVKIGLIMRNSMEFDMNLSGHQRIATPDSWQGLGSTHGPFHS